MKKLIIASAFLLTIALPAIAHSPDKCEISCNPQYQQADKKLNETWRSLSDTERRILRPAQRQWIKDRDNKCGKNDDCLTTVTKKQTEVLNNKKSCVRGGGGLSCFEGK